MRTTPRHECHASNLPDSSRKSTYADCFHSPDRQRRNICSHTSTMRASSGVQRGGSSARTRPEAAWLYTVTSPRPQPVSPSPKHRIGQDARHPSVSGSRSHSSQPEKHLVEDVKMKTGHDETECRHADANDDLLECFWGANKPHQHRSKQRK